MVELAAGDFTRSLGSGPGQVQFTANGGGFAAVGANRFVNLGGSSAYVDLGQQRFSAQRRDADARHAVGRFDDRFSKPDQSGQWDANRPGDRRLRHGAVNARLSGRPQRQRRADDRRAAATWN